MLQIKKGKPYHEVDLDRFSNLMEQCSPPCLDLMNKENISNLIEVGCNTMNNAARNCLNEKSEWSNEWDIAQPCLGRLLKDNDPKMIWKAINWKGGVNTSNVIKPDERQFKVHFESFKP